MALETEDPEIIKMVKDAIVQRMLLQNVAITRGFSPVAKYTNLPETINTYSN